MRWVAWLYLLNTILLVIIAIREARRPAKALTGLVVGIVFPVIGFLFYLITSARIPVRGDRLTVSRNTSDPLPDTFSRSAVTIAHALHRFSVSGLKTCRVKVLTNGREKFPNLIEALRRAQHTIEMEYYIYRHDQIGKQITDTLIERARAGVRVRFIKDGVGSIAFPKAHVQRMMAAGVQCKTMYPIRFPSVVSTLNYRDHCKIVVVDGQAGFTGGINVGDEYLGLDSKIGNWRDTQVRVEGGAAEDLRAIFEAHWKLASEERVSARTRQFANRPVAKQTAAFSTEASAELSTIDTNRSQPGVQSLPEAYVQTLESNPGLPTQIIREAFFICITQAAQSVDITTPYLIPDADIIVAMKTAVARGVRVRLMVPGHPDHWVVGLAAQTYFGELLEAGVHIYLYNNGFLHAKVTTVDREVAVVGAASYDMRSFRLDYEDCEVIYSTAVAEELTAQFERDLLDSTPLSQSHLEERSTPRRLAGQVARLLGPLL